MILLIKSLNSARLLEYLAVKSWDTAKHTLDFGFVCPFVVIDSTYQGATPVTVSCAMTNDWQLSSYPRRRIPAFTPHGIKASL
jgi:hypothetical protein